MKPLDYQNLSTRYNRPLHAMALFTAAITFPLIFMGGLVTSHSAGMSVPDWPNSYGYNMFLFPPRLWIGGILYEHTHRLMATVVGFCATVLALIAWGPGGIARGRRIVRAAATVLLTANAIGTAAMVVWPRLFRLAPSVTSWNIVSQGAVGGAGILICAAIALACRNTEHRRWVRWLATSVLGMVIFQGVLGGLRVVLVKLDLAIVHACVAQAFFCLAALVCIVTSRWWIDAPRPAVASSRLVPLAMTCVVIVYAQLMVGAVMRHNQAGLAIPDLPLAYGKLLPPTNGEQLAAANRQLLHLIDSSPNPRDRDLPHSVTLFQVWIQFAHRIGAVVVSAAIGLLLAEVLKNRRFYPREIKRPALLLLLLLATQITLGVLTVVLRKPADVATAHVAVGALVLVTCFVLSARGLRLYSSASRGSSRPAAATVPARQFSENREANEPAGEAVTV